MTTMLETLDETAAAYTSETRAAEKRVGFSDGCQYFVDGRCCSVGRCLEDPERFERILCSVTTLDERHTLESILKPEYRGFPLKFWQSLQNLHDIAANWDHEGLSDRGRHTVRKIKEAFNL